MAKDRLKELIDAAMDEYMDGSYADSGSARDQMERLVSDAVTPLNDRIAVLTNALQGIINMQPCYDNGECFYPQHDGEGNYIGEHHVDPISVIGGMVDVATKAIAE